MAVEQREVLLARGLGPPFIRAVTVPRSTEQETAVVVARLGFMERVEMQVTMLEAQEITETPPQTQTEHNMVLMGLEEEPVGLLATRVQVVRKEGVTVRVGAELRGILVARVVRAIRVSSL